MSNDILDTAWQQSFSPNVKKTISKDEAIALLKKHHVYSSDCLDNAYLRSCDCCQPTDSEIVQLRKNLEGVPDSEIESAMARLRANGESHGVNAADSASAMMDRINSDAEKRRTSLIIDGVSVDKVEQQMEIYISERIRLAFGSDGH